MNILKKWWVLPLLIGLVYLGKYIYQMPKFDDGEAAPNFEWALPSGDQVQLSDLKGKYVLLDFWGSWCGPCRQHIPDLIQLHDKYNQSAFKNANGFEIVSVGIERDQNRWKRAIEGLNLKWTHHVFDATKSFKFFDSKVAQLYSIKSVPRPTPSMLAMTVVASGKRTARNSREKRASAARRSNIIERKKLK